MKVLIIGANGYVGARLFVDLQKKFEVTGTYNKNQFFKELVHLDITDQKELHRVFDEYKPDVIIHPANHASPRPAADDPEGYKKLNLLSTEYVREAADSIGAKLVFISSFAALNPDNIYGKLKVKSEEIVKKTQAGYLIVRPSIILGLSPNTHNDRPFNRILRCFDDGTNAEFDTSWHFQPTYIGHLSEVLSTAIEKGIFNETIHVFCPSIQTQYSTADDILKPFAIEVKPVDKKMLMPIQEKNESELTELGLPTCSYQKMITKIHEEIRGLLNKKG